MSQEILANVIGGTLCLIISGIGVKLSHTKYRLISSVVNNVIETIQNDCVECGAKLGPLCPKCQATRDGV